MRHNRKPHAAPSPVAPPPNGSMAMMHGRDALESPAEAGDQAVAATTPPAPLNPTLVVDRRGRLVLPRALMGSREVLMNQNEMAYRDGLGRIQDDDDLERMRARKALVAIPSSGAGIQTDGRLPMNRRYCTPWAAQFLAALGRAHYARFGRALQVNSAVRTVEFQQRLIRRNGIATPYRPSSRSREAWTQPG